MRGAIGSLCTGYGGLDMAAQAVLGGDTVWVSDIDKGACKLLAHRYPDVPNLGDFTRTDWSTVEPVDVLTAGFPCQPVSHAGKRLGIEDERWLWDDVARAVSELRPGLVVLENVRGLLTAGGGRLFGRVLGTLAALGYDAQWHGLRAADVGAPHGRWRVFIAATDAERGGFARWSPVSERRPLDRAAAAWGGEGTGGPLLPSPRTSDTNGPGMHGDGGMDLRTVVSLLPTPTTTQRGTDANLDTRDGARANLHNEVAKLLPTPLNADAGPRGGTTGFGLRDWSREHDTDWGQYAPAIRLWEQLTRPAPAPTELSAKGNPRLSPRFSEWLMGLPAGWITEVPGVTRNEALKLAGNGVVPQQAEAALSFLLSIMELAG